MTMPSGQRGGFRVGWDLLLSAPTYRPTHSGELMRRIALLFALLLSAQQSSLATQSAEEEVTQVVRGLFEAMAAADSARVRELFNPQARLIGTGGGEDGMEVRILPIERFIAAVGGADGWNERIWDVEVRVDDNLATVWTKYDFLLHGQFSHCGVDSFQLVRTTDGWKIISIADTRRTEGCEAPPDG